MAYVQQKRYILDIFNCRFNFCAYFIQKDFSKIANILNFIQLKSNKLLYFKKNIECLIQNYYKDRLSINDLLNFRIIF